MRPLPSLHAPRSNGVGHGKRNIPGEGTVELEDILKVLSLVAAGLPHLPDLDHVKDDLADIASAAETPSRQHRWCQISVLLEAVPTGRLAELLARDMPFCPAGIAARPGSGLAAPGGLLLWNRLEFVFRRFDSEAERLLGERQGLEDKQIRVERVTPVTGEQIEQGMRFIDERHETVVFLQDLAN